MATFVLYAALLLWWCVLTRNHFRAARRARAPGITFLALTLALETAELALLAAASAALFVDAWTPPPVVATVLIILARVTTTVRGGFFQGVLWGAEHGQLPLVDARTPGGAVRFVFDGAARVARKRGQRLRSRLRGVSPFRRPK